MTKSDTEIEVGRYALRTFREADGELISASMNGSHWNDGVCEGICVNRSDSTHPHPTPTESCSCGIYGTLSLGHLMSQYGYLAHKLVTVMAAEGTTIIGDRGLRTAYARIVGYWCKEDSDQILNICKKQFVSAAHFTDLAKMLEEYNFPTNDFAFDGNVEIDWAFADAVPDRGQHSTKIYTIYNMRPGTYNEITLSCGYKMAITPVTFAADGGCLVATLNWTPCSIAGCPGCPDCQ